MTSTQPPDELETLIDLLVDTGRETTPESPATALGHAAGVVQLEQSGERTDSLQALLSFNPAIIDSAGVIRQSTPVPCTARGRADPAPVPNYANISHSALTYDTVAGDLMHPLSPHLPAVRSAAIMSNPTTKERDLPAPDTVIPAPALDLLPMSPFLLSPSPNTRNNDDSESPFFVVGGSEGSPENPPHSSLISLSGANAEYGTSPDHFVSQGLWEEYSAPSSKKLSIEHLTENLHQARAELNVVSRECERLKQLVQCAGFDTDSQTPALASRVFVNDAAVDSLINQPLSSVAEVVMDDVDRMSGAEAKQKLKDVLAYLNLPAASLEDVPSSRAAESPIPPLTKTTPAPATAATLPLCSADFAGVRRSLAFLERVDDLVWKRSIFSQFGTGFFPSGGADVVPVDLRLRDGRQVPRRTSSTGMDNTTIDGDRAEATGRVHSPNVFGETNVKALEERLNLWERAVRSRPRR